MDYLIHDDSAASMINIFIIKWIDDDLYYFYRINFNLNSIKKTRSDRNEKSVIK